MQNLTCGYADISLTRVLRLIDQSGLLAAVAAQLLTFFKDDSNFKNPNGTTRDIILAFIYISLISSIFSTMDALALTVMIVYSKNRQSSTLHHLTLLFKLCTTCLIQLVAG